MSHRQAGYGGEGPKRGTGHLSGMGRPRSPEAHDQRQELWGDVRPDDTGPSQKERFSRAMSIYSDEQVLKAYRLAHADNGLTHAEIGEKCGGMSASTVGDIARHQSHEHITREAT